MLYKKKNSSKKYIKFLKKYGPHFTNRPPLPLSSPLPLMKKPDDLLDMRCFIRLFGIKLDLKNLKNYFFIFKTQCFRNNIQIITFYF